MVKLRLEKNSTVIHISENSAWYNDVTQKMQAYFSKTFWVNHILINLPIKGEEGKRKLFLLELYKICSKNSQKHNSRFLKRLLESSHKPIKLMVSEISMPVKSTTIKIHVTKNRLFFQLPKDETFLFWYLFNHLKKYTPEHRFFKKQFWVNHPPKELHDVLINLFAAPQIFDYYVNYHYDVHALNKFFDKAKSTTVKKEIDPLKVHYQTLEVKENVHMEELRRKYLQLAKQYHPDRAANNAEARIKTTKFQKIQEAYHAIKAQKKASA